MTLAFSTKFPKGKPGLEGKPTRFVEKILESMNVHQLTEFHPWNEKVDQLEKMDFFDFDYLYNDPTPKIHTMRSDEKDRWKKGKLIHPVINNRTPERFQFAPKMVCSGTERISLIHRYARTIVMIDEKFYCDSDDPKMLKLAQNDGFDSVDDFFAWFNQDWAGKIIHWTPFRYVPESIIVDAVQVDPKTGKDRPCDCWLENSTCKCETIKSKKQ